MDKDSSRVIQRKRRPFLRKAVYKSIHLMFFFIQCVIWTILRIGTNAFSKEKRSQCLEFKCLQENHVKTNEIVVHFTEYEVKATNDINKSESERTQQNGANGKWSLRFTCYITWTHRIQSFRTYLYKYMNIRGIIMFLKFNTIKTFQSNDIMQFCQNIFIR